MKNVLLFSLFFVTTMFGNTKIDSNSSSNTSSTASNTELSAVCTSCTKIITSQCGGVLAAVSTPVWANPVASATNYRFEITKGSNVTVYESTNRYFLISQLGAGIPAYNTTYSVRVAVKIAGVWDDYGVSCDVSTPANPSATKVVADQCGSTLALVTSSIFAEDVYLATDYRFEVSDGVDVVGVVENPYRFFQLSQLAGVAFNSTYSVRVATKYDGVWGAYGASCNVTTPNSATATKVVASQCGTTIPTLNTFIFADQVYLATAYRFEVTNGSTVRTFESPTRSFQLSQLSGTVDYGTTYSIRVEVFFGGVWQAYGQSCDVTVPPLTSLINGQCGATLSSVATAIWAKPVSGATAYRFEVKRGSGAANTYDSTNRYFRLSLLPTIARYGATYTIRVTSRYNNTWLPYGAACTVTTPAAPGLSQVVDAQCGAVLDAVSTRIFANEIFNATDYRFEVTNGSTVTTFDTTNRFFQLSQLSSIAYNTTYGVKVAYKFGGVWSAFGSSCNVTTPSDVTATKVIDAQCGATLATVNTPILVNEVYLATDYRFEVTNGLNVRTYEATNRYFNLSQLSGGGTPSTTYSVRAAVKFNDVWQGYGVACNVTTPAISISRMSNSNELQANVFAVKAFPNPFVSYFNLSIESSSDELVEVKVYDMIGRQLESSKATVTELTSKEIGVDYPAGVYNVIISQGNQLKTLRMIKR